MKLLRDRFLKIRKDLGLNQAEMGRAIKITRSAVSQIESGQTKNLRGDTLAHLIKLSGYSPTWIVDGRGPEKLPTTPVDQGDMPISMDQLAEADTETLMRLMAAIASTFNARKNEQNP